MPEKNDNRLLVNIEYFFFMLGVKTIRALPVKIAYKLSEIALGLFFYISIRHRKRAVEHLMHAGITDDLQQAKRVAKTNFQEFGKTFVEICKSDQFVNETNADEHIRFTGDQEAIDFFDSSKNPSNCIIVTAHYGNWEMSGITYTILSGHSLLSPFRPLNNPKIGKFIYKQRDRYNHKGCPKKGAIKHLFKALKNGGSIGFVADQHANRKEGVETQFFGQPARTHSSPAQLHLKTKTPIIVFVLHRIDNTFNFEFRVKGPYNIEPTGDKEKDIQIVAQTYTTALEELIRKCPEQWLWSHRRWLNINR